METALKGAQQRRLQRGEEGKQREEGLGLARKRIIMRKKGKNLASILD